MSHNNIIYTILIRIDIMGFTLFSYYLKDCDYIQLVYKFHSHIHINYTTFIQMSVMASCTTLVLALIEVTCVVGRWFWDTKHKMRV